MLLKNYRRALPLDAAQTKKVAVVGPLADTLYTDWYGGALPYQVTPLDGISERLGAGGTVDRQRGRRPDRAQGRRAPASTSPRGTGAAGAVAQGERHQRRTPTAQFDVVRLGPGRA